MIWMTKSNCARCIKRIDCIDDAQDLERNETLTGPACYNITWVFNEIRKLKCRKNSCEISRKRVNFVASLG